MHILSKSTYYKTTNFNNDFVNDKNCKFLPNFCASQANTLMNYAEVFNCAYSGRPMLKKEVIQKILQKLVNKQSANDALEILKNYIPYIYHSEILSLFMRTNDKTRLDFRDILQSNKEQASKILEAKERNVLNSTNGLLKGLDNKKKNFLKLIREEALDKMTEGVIIRNFVLKQIKALIDINNDNEVLKSIYRAWYKLPRVSNDKDAFIVHYANCSQNMIAKKLINPAEASIEHIIPSSRDGGDELCNTILVCNQFNSERNSLKLDEYCMLNPDLDIPRNLQNYINAVIREINDGNSWLSKKCRYPDGIQKKVLQDSSGYIVLDTSQLKIKKKK